MATVTLRKQSIPDDSWWNNSAFPWIHRSPDDKYFAVANYQERQVLLAALKNHFSNGEVIPWAGQFYTGYAGSYLESQTGTVETQSYTLHKDRETFSNADFQKKVDEGKIVVSDFTSDVKIKVEARAPSEVVSSTFLETRTDTMINMSGLIVPVADPTNQGWGDCYTVGGVTYRGGDFKVVIDRVVEETKSDFGDYSASDHCHKILKNFMESEQDGSLIVGCLASANDGSFDALTALAESVESYSSILKFIIEMFTMYKEARKGEVRLTNKLSRLRKIEQPNAQLRKEIQETVDAVTGIWLSYRLAIKPTISMIEDILALDTSSGRQYIRYREGSSREVSFSYGSENCVGQIQHRVFIKRCYESWLSALGINPLRTIWELIPLSFVLDRYMRIGDSIAALSPNISIDEGATYSWKMSNDSVTGEYDGIKYTITTSAYRRVVIQPSHYCGISYPTSRSVEQKLDHLALIWQIFMKDFLFSKKGK